MECGIQLPILDKSLIRHDVLKIIEDNEKIRKQAYDEFFKIPENQEFDFLTLWRKVMAGNARSLKGENMSGYLNKEEQLFLAKFHRFIVEYLSNYRQKFVSPISNNVKCKQVDVGGVPAEWHIVPNAHEKRIMLYFHGGGYIMGSPNFRRNLTVNLGNATKMRVLSIDYRLAPEHPYPAGLDDCIGTYNWLLSQGINPKNIIISGDSAGGYFTIMTLVSLRNDGIALPAGAVCLSPATDLDLTSDSYVNNAPTDPVLAGLGIFWWADAYLGGVDPQLASPVNANLTDIPPILIQASTSEMLFNDSTRFVEHAKSTGIDVTLQTWDDTLHVFQAFDLPEAVEAISEIGKFIQRRIK